MSDTLEIFGTEYTGATGIKATDDNGNIKTYVRPQGTISITSNGTGIDVSSYASADVSVSGGGGALVVTISYNLLSGKWEPDCTFSDLAAAQEIAVVASGSAVADGRWITIGTTYGYTVRTYVYDDSTSESRVDEYEYTFTSSGITCTDTYTYYETADADAVASSVPNGKIFYTSTGRAVGSATARSASDLSVSGATVTVPAGFYSSQATKSVASGTAGTPTATKGTVSNHSISVTPSVTNTTGYITGSTKTGTAVTVSASELVSGSETKTSNGTYDVTNLASLVVNVSGGSSKAIYKYLGFASRTANSYGSTSASVTVTKAGTYTISYCAIRGSSSGTMGTNLHIGSTTGTNNQTFNNGTYGQYVQETNVSIAANTDITIYATSGSNSRTIYVGMLVVEEQ